MVGLAVVAFRDGGVTAVGTVTAARMAAAALLAPWLATVADRVRRERVLTTVGLIRAAALGAARGGHGRRRARGRHLRPGRRRHGRVRAVPPGALGPAARVVHVAAAADARERGPWLARLVGDARWARGGGHPAGGEWAGGCVRGLRGSVAAWWAGRGRALLRRPAASGNRVRPPLGGPRPAGVQDHRGRPRPGADHGARPRADVHARLSHRPHRRGRHRPSGHGRLGRGRPDRGRRSGRDARVAPRVRPCRARPTCALVRRRRRALRGAARPRWRRPS